MGESTGGE
jgi:hypothetical protein